MPKGIYPRSHMKPQQWRRGKLTTSDVIQIKEMLNAGKSHREIAERFSVQRSNIGQIANGITWVDVGVIDIQARISPCVQCGSSFRKKSVAHRFCTNKCKERWESSHVKGPYAKTPKQQRNYKSRMLRRFGMTLPEYDSLVVAQGGRCAICLKESPGSRYNRFAVDHDHKTGKVRGLLCRACNTGLGFFEDDQKLLMSAMRYLSSMEQASAAI